jgi:hypothetical protein
MLKKSFILALFFASFTIFVQGQCLIDHLIIPTKDTNCRRGTLQFELQNDLQNKDSIRRAIDTFVIFKWGYVGSIDTTTSSSIVFPSRGNIFGEIWIDVIDTLNKCSLPRHTIIIDTFPYPTREKEKIIDTTLCINDTLVLRVAEFENVTELWWGNRNDELRDDSLTIVFNSENPRNSDRYYYFVVTYLGACPLDYLYINPNPYEIINDTVAKIFFARPPIIDLGVDTILCGNSHQLTTLDKTVFLIDEYKFRWNDSATLTQNIFTVLYDEQEKTQTITIEIWNEICRQRSTED